MSPKVMLMRVLRQQTCHGMSLLRCMHSLSKQHCGMSLLQGVHPLRWWQCVTWDATTMMGGRGLFVEEAGAEEAGAFYGLVVTPLVYACLVA